MGNIGSDIATGAAHALWGIVTHIPLMVWIIIAVGLVGFGILMRYMTNIKLDLFLFALFVIVNSLIYYRQHWIDQGYAEAQEQVKASEAKVAAYQRTNKMIEACYAKNTRAEILWDRTQGKCLRADGALVQ